jgi:hypothetical protein
VIVILSDSYAAHTIQLSYEYLIHNSSKLSSCRILNKTIAKLSCLHIFSWIWNTTYLFFRFLTFITFFRSFSVFSTKQKTLNFFFFFFISSTIHSIVLIELEYNSNLTRDLIPRNCNFLHFFPIKFFLFYWLFQKKTLLLKKKTAIFPLIHNYVSFSLSNFCKNIMYFIYMKNKFC